MTDGVIAHLAQSHFCQPFLDWGFGWRVQFQLCLQPLLLRKQLLAGAQPFLLRLILGLGQGSIQYLALSLCLALLFQIIQRTRFLRAKRALRGLAPERSTST